MDIVIGIIIGALVVAIVAYFFIPWLFVEVMFGSIESLTGRKIKRK
jgi:high-affinity Fe2+/Pb2+ permease